MENNIVSYSAFSARRAAQLVQSDTHDQQGHVAEVISLRSVRTRQDAGQAYVAQQAVQGYRGVSHDAPMLVPRKVLHYRVQYDGFDETVTDPVVVHRLTRSHPEATVQVVKILT